MWANYLTTEEFFDLKEYPFTYNLDDVKYPSKINIFVVTDEFRKKLEFDASLKNLENNKIDGKNNNSFLTEQIKSSKKVSFDLKGNISNLKNCLAIADIYKKIENGGHLSHNQAVFFAKVLVYFGRDGQNEIHKIMKISEGDGYLYEKTQYQIDHFIKRGHYPATCEYCRKKWDLCSDCKGLDNDGTPTKYAFQKAIKKRNEFYYKFNDYEIIVLGVKKELEGVKCTLEIYKDGVIKFKNKISLWSSRSRNSFIKECKEKEIEISDLDNFLINLESKLKKPAEYNKNGITPKAIADEIMEKRFFKTARDNEEIYVYDELNGIYINNAETFIKEMVLERIDEDTSRYIVNEVIAIVKTSTYIGREEFNQNHNLIHLKNGIFDIYEKKLNKFTPEIISTLQIPVIYNPETDCPNIKKFLYDVLLQDDIPIIQELTGYCLLKDYRFQTAFMFIGEGANGKSTLINLTKDFLGKKNISSISIQDLEDNKFASAELNGKLANIYADITSSTLKQTSKFKILTGGDSLTGERKFKNPFQFINFAKLIFSANVIPKSWDDTNAFFRRWIIINFPNSFEGKSADKKIIEKLTTDDELSGLFNWVIGGLDRLIKNEEFSNSKTTDEIRETYIRFSDPLKYFVNECVNLVPDGYISKEDFYSSFRLFCFGEKLPITSKSMVGRNLSSIIPSISDGKKKIGGDRKRVWFGINLIDEGGQKAQKAQKSLIMEKKEDINNNNNNNNK